MKLKKSEQGFITMIVVLILVIGAVVFFAYMRVKGAQGS